MSAELQPDAIDEEHLQLRMLEAEIAREIAHHESEGGNASKIPLEVLEGDLKKMQFLVKVKEYVSSFAPEEQQSVVERIAKEGFPPELLASPDSFIIEGNETVH